MSCEKCSKSDPQVSRMGKQEDVGSGHWSRKHTNNGQVRCDGPWTKMLIILYAFDTSGTVIGILVVSVSFLLPYQNIRENQLKRKVNLSSLFQGSQFSPW